jgi:isoleucyl-tRNA synthetase
MLLSQVLFDSSSSRHGYDDTSVGGTGIVHQAPAFGEDDYRVCLFHNILPKGFNFFF